MRIDNIVDFFEVNIKASPQWRGNLIKTQGIL